MEKTEVLNIEWVKNILLIHHLLIIALVIVVGILLGKIKILKKRLDAITVNN
jgi:hypothetical protein